MKVLSILILFFCPSTAQQLACPLVSTFDIPSNSDTGLPVLVLTSGVRGEVFVKIVDDATQITVEFRGVDLQVDKTTDKNDETTTRFAISVNSDTSGALRSVVGLQSLLALAGNAKYSVYAASPWLLAFALVFAPTAAASSSHCQYPEITIKVPPGFPVNNIVIMDDQLTFGIEDPAPNIMEPGETTCVGCPTSGYSEDFVKITPDLTFPMTGKMTGSSGDGIWYVVDEEDQTNGRRLNQFSVSQPASRGVIPTDKITGEFSVTLPLFCGAQLVKSVWSNKQGTYVLAQRVEAGGANCTPSAIHATLTWEDIGNDWDLHLIKPNGCVNSAMDTYFSNKVTTWSSLDIDCTSDCSTENIIASASEMVSGLYYVVLHNYRGINNVSGAVTIRTLSRDGLSRHDNVHVTGLVEHKMLLIATVDGDTGAITRVGVAFNGCSQVPTDMIVLADRRVAYLGGLAYHYSLQRWSGISKLRPGGSRVNQFECTDLTVDGTKVASVELLRDVQPPLRSWVYDNTNQCWNTEDVAISRITYSDTAVYCLPLIYGSVEQIWTTIMEEAGRYVAGEQPGLAPPNLVVWPNSFYNIDRTALAFDSNPPPNSNTFIREMVRLAGLEWVEMSGFHQGREGNPTGFFDPLDFSPQPFGANEAVPPLPLSRGQRGNC